jgi:hypothetical protein
MMYTLDTNREQPLPLLLLLLPFLALTAHGHGVRVTSPAEVVAGVQAPISIPSCSGPVKGVPDGFWLDQQNHTGTARGYAPFIDNYYAYPTYRNAVKDYKANNDSSGDQTGFLQAALNDDGRGGNRYQQGTTYEPATVFLPSGTYQLQSKLDLRMGTIIAGDPLNPPVIRAAADFVGDTLVNGYDFATGHPEDSFMTLLKNVIIDTTSISADRQITALQWGVAQGCGLTNVQILMPSGPTKHSGIVLDGGSTIIVSDVVSHSISLLVTRYPNTYSSKLLAANTELSLPTNKSTSRTCLSRIAKLHFGLLVASLISSKVRPSTLVVSALIFPLEALPPWCFWTQAPSILVRS